MKEPKPLEPNKLNQFAAELDNLLEKFNAIMYPKPEIQPNGTISAVMFIYERPEDGKGIQAETTPV